MKNTETATCPVIYPKDFLWTGWHPRCRCTSIAVTLSYEEMLEVSALPEDEYKSYKPKGLVTELPENFKRWFAANKVRIVASYERGNPPYFLRDNPKRIVPMLPDESAAASGRKLGCGMGKNATKRALEAIGGDYLGKTKFSEAQKQNMKEIEQTLGIQRDKPMTFDNADNTSPNLSKANDNCPNCVLAYEMRRRGFNVTAGKASDAFGDDTTLPWLTEQGTKPKVHKVATDRLSDGQAVDLINRQMSAIGGRYHVGWDGDKYNYGHIITAERTEQGLVFYDPQEHRKNMMFYSIEEIVDRSRKNGYLETLRVDVLLLNPKLIMNLVQPATKRNR